MMQIDSLADWTVVELAGRDRQDFLNKFCTNDLRPLGVGDGCEAFLTDVKGKTLAHVIVGVGGQVVRLVAPPGQGSIIVSHLDRYCIRENVQFLDATPTTSVWHLWGPTQGGPPRTGLPDKAWQHALVECGGAKLSVQRFAAMQPPSWLAIGARADRARIEMELANWRALSPDLGAWTARRIDAGWPLFGVDFGSDNLPQEVGRDADAISFRKGCYLGQETVARIDALGHVNRQLVWIEFPGANEPPAIGAEVSFNEEGVGRLTSVAKSPTLGVLLGIALVRRQATAVGTVLDCGAAQGRVVKPPASGAPA